MIEDILKLVGSVGVPGAVIFYFMWRVAPAISEQTKAFNKLTSKIDSLAITPQLFNMIKELLLLQSKALGVPESKLKVIRRMNNNHGSSDGDHTSGRN